MKKECFLITNIQRFSLHDGPGIRTTVFLKGCSLHCPWCSNPENINSEPQEYEKDGITGLYGQYYSSEVLIKECLKDKSFYEGRLSQKQWNINSEEQIKDLPGGVTFSGGEPLLRMEALMPVISALHEEGVHVTAETCLFVPTHLLLLSLNYIDFFYCDIKILTEEKCTKIEGGNLELYLNNLDELMKWKDKHGRRKPVVFRIPAIGHYTDTEENRTAIKDLIKKYKEHILKIELIKEHNLAESKYKSLGRRIDFHGVEDVEMEMYKSEISALGVPVEVCKIQTIGTGFCSDTNLGITLCNKQPFRSEIIKVLERNRDNKSLCISSVYDFLEERFIENGGLEALPGNQQTLRNQVHYLKDHGIIATNDENARVYDTVFDMAPGEQMLIDFGEIG